MTNRTWVQISIGGFITLAIWTILFLSYRLDRPSQGAFIGASMNVLLVVPPLLSYYAVMAWFRRYGLLWLQIVAVYGVAIAWLMVQRTLIYPIFGLQAELGENLGNFIILPAFGIATWMGVHSLRLRRQLAEARQLEELSQLRLLEAQLAPHWLFNQFNTVYATMLEEPEKAPPLLLAMTQLMRHLVEQTRRDHVPVQRELDFMQNMALLERARHLDKADIQIEALGDLDAPVPPMLFATLFENAIKHGQLEEGGYQVRVQLHSEEQHISCEISNRFTPGVTNKSSLGVGLENVRRRLAMLYPDSHEFATSVAEDIYQAKLILRS